MEQIKSIQLVPGYQLLEKIQTIGKFNLYRGHSLKDHRNVIVKFYESGQTDPLELEQLKTQFQLLKSLNHPHIVTSFGFEETPEGIAFIYEQIEGTNLQRDIQNKGPYSFEEFFRIAIQMINAIEWFHANNFVHRDIKPSNFAIDVKSGSAILIHLGVSDLEKNETLTSSNDGESLFYISPEQTGRMNKTVDDRSDLYSLGVCFYYLLTGKAPFIETDPLALFYMHIAQDAPLINLKRKETPPVIADFVKKLMSKSADDRYQSIIGLKFDLIKCASDMANNQLVQFKLATKDSPKILKLSDKFYGRENELERLLKAFQACGSDDSLNSLVLVGGPSGIGKSTLIQELQKPLVKERGRFISGKYDQAKRDHPFLGVMQAFNDLLNQIFLEGTESLTTWRIKLEDSLGALAGVLKDSLPFLEEIMGKQETPIQLPSEEAEKRFYSAMVRLTSVFAQRHHPLVIFIDDLQWADLASFKLIIELLKSQASQSLMIICSYRDNEIYAAHPFHELERSINSKFITKLTLNNLQLSDITNLVADTFRKDAAACNELAEIIYNKTLGNPFFTHQMIKHIYDTNLINLDSEGHWEFKIEDIKKLPISTNVVELMVHKLRTLSGSLLQLLQIAAVLGSRFQVIVLAKVSGLSEANLYQLLLVAIKENLITPSSGEYSFQHDRIQEAAYSLLLEEEKLKLHEKVGQAYLGLFDQDKRKSYVFEIVNHLNKGRATDLSQDKLNQLAQLNQEAGNRAISIFAYGRAIDYYNEALKLFADRIFSEFYENAISLHHQLSRAYRSAGKYQEAESILDKALGFAKSKEDRAQIQIEKMILYTFLTRYLESIRTGLVALKEFGIDLPEQPSTLSVLRHLISINRQVKKLPIDKIVNGPELKDKTEYMVMSILIEMGAPTYNTGSKLAPIVMAILVKRGLLYGNCDFSASGYTGLIAMNMLIFRDYSFCQKLRDIGFQLNARYPNPFVEARMLYLEMMFVKYFSVPVKTLREDIFKVFNSCVNSGQKLYGEFSCVAFADYLVLFSQNISDCLGLFESRNDYMAEAANKVLNVIFENEKNLFRTLYGQTTVPITFAGQPFQEKALMEKLIEGRNFPALVTYISMPFLTSYILGDDQKGKLYLQYADLCLKTVKGHLQEVVLRMLRGLYAARQHYSADKRTQTQNLKSLRRELKWFKKLQQSGPENYQPLYFLLQAEEARITGSIEKAANLYDMALDKARTEKWPFFYAVTCENAGEFYLSLKKNRIAKSYLQDAKQTFSRWGSPSKVAQLDKKHLEFFSLSSSNLVELDNGVITTAPSNLEIHRNVNSVANSYGSSIDLLSVLKSTRILAKEVVLANLLEQIMSLMMENAGAQRGAFILNRTSTQAKNGSPDPLQGWMIEVLGEEKQGKREIILPSKMPLTSTKNLPLNFIRYIMQTSESVVLDNACSNQKFGKEAFFSENKILSVIALPITNQAKILGILYLENNLTSGAFTPERIEVLSLLANQVAVSIENALLYSNMEEEIQDRTKDIRSIMENVRYGIFTFGSDFRIHPEYSSHLKQIFKQETIAGLPATQFLFANADISSEQRSQIESALINIMGEDELQFVMNHKILPNELSYKNGQQILQLDWVYELNSEDIIQKMMVTVRDVTELRQAEVLAKKQARELQLISSMVKVSANKVQPFIQESLRLLEDCQAHLQEGLKPFAPNHPKSYIDVTLARLIFRNLHTLKGNARIFGFSELTSRIHTIEAFYSTFLNSPPDQQLQKDFAQAHEELNEIDQMLNEIVSIYEKIFGSTQHQLDLDWEKISHWLDVKDLKSVNALVTSKVNLSLNQILEPILKSLPETAKSLGRLSPKVLLPSTPILIPRNISQELMGTFNHLFTNALTHGLSSKEGGQITIEYSSLGSSASHDFHHILRVFDDGPGIAIEKLHQKGLEKNYLTPDSDDLSIADTIWSEGVSTAANTTQLSGRGIGMSAIKSTLEKMGGQIGIEFSAPKLNGYRPFSFVIKIPVRNGQHLKAVG